MATKKKVPVADQAAEPTFTKEQLVKAKTLNLPRDAVAAVLEDGRVDQFKRPIRLNIVGDDVKAQAHGDVRIKKRTTWVQRRTT